MPSTGTPASNTICGARGLQALRDGDRIKREIEKRYERKIGTERLGALMDALRALDAKD